MLKEMRIVFLFVVLLLVYFWSVEVGKFVVFDPFWFVSTTSRN